MFLGCDLPEGKPHLVHKATLRGETVMDMKETKVTVTWKILP